MLKLKKISYSLFHKSMGTFIRSNTVNKLKHNDEINANCNGF